MNNERDLKPKNSNVPALRFNYRDAWKPFRLGDLMSFQNGLNAESERYGRGIKFISVKDILNNDFITYESVEGLVDATEKEKETFKVTYGDIVFQRSSEVPSDIGRSNTYLDNAPCLFGGFVIRGHKQGAYHPYFLKTALESPINRKTIIRLGAGAQHYNIGQESIRSAVINLPTLSEQEMIADLFKSLNKRIEVQNKIIEAYRSSIKPLFNRLDTGKKRSVSLEEMGEFHGTDNLSLDDMSTAGDPAIIYGELFTKYQYVVRKVISSSSKSIRSLSSGKDLLFPSSTTVDSYSLIAPAALLQKGVKLGGDMFYLTLLDEFDPVYISLLINLKYKAPLSKFAQGSTIIHLHYKDVRGFRLNVAEPQRQKEISRLILKIMASIECEKRRLELFQKQKQFLLSALFI